MRIAFLCKRRYMGKDVVNDRYARLYEIPAQLARRSHTVLGLTLGYQGQAAGQWEHDALPGSLTWQAEGLSGLRLPGLLTYPRKALSALRAFSPDLLIGASDIPHVALTGWLARRLKLPYVVDLYDNFEGFGQARLPGFVPLLRQATRDAALVTTTSEPLRALVLAEYAPRGKVMALPSTVDRSVFHRRDQKSARQTLGLPLEGKLVGTAGGLYRDKGIEPLYAAWPDVAARCPDAHLVLAGPLEKGFPPPKGPRVHYLGHLPHEHIAELFCALDVGVISILDTPFGRYCFPQKAYEMLACGLAVVAADVGAMRDLFATTPDVLFKAADPESLARGIVRQLATPSHPQQHIADWKELAGQLDRELQEIMGSAFKAAGTRVRVS